jgi:hypothetical protein
MPRTIWSLAHNKLGDLIVGSEDKNIRTFTRDYRRRDEGPDFTAYQEECKGQAKPQSGLDMENTIEFSIAVAQGIKGASEGELKVFKDKGIAKAYMWKGEEGKWEEIGEVVDPDGQKQ